MRRRRWEALAAKLPPMIRLGRVSIDHNFGLVQRYRSFVRCRQTAFFMECNAPAIVSSESIRRSERRARAAASYWLPASFAARLRRSSFLSKQVAGMGLSQPFSHELFAALLA